MPSQSEKPGPAAEDHIANSSPENGSATGDWLAVREDVKRNVNPPHSAAQAEAALAATQATSDMLAKPDESATGVFLGDSGVASSEPEVGGATTGFVPGRQDLGDEGGGTTNFSPDDGGGTTNFVPGQEEPASGRRRPSRHDTEAMGGRSRSLSRQVLGTQRIRTDATGAARDRAPEAPELATSRFQLMRFHARGGMGEIWQAEDQDVGRSVALKKMRRGGTPEQKDAFLREAQITGQLEHPGVVPVHELGEDETGEPFYVMKFVNGRTLTDAIVEYHGPAHLDGISREVQGLGLLQTFLNICQTVAFAHSQRIIHRDLKPDNVMVGAYGETLLLDWGLAKSVDQVDTPGTPGFVRYSYSGESLQTLAGSIKGTPSYMAPEAAEGNIAAVDESSDIYLLGGTLYHILTGKRPREAKRVAEYIELARKTPPVPPRKLVPTIPKPLDAICQKAMAHRKEDRYVSAQALVEDVQRYLAGEPVTAYRENLWERSWRWIKRHRVLLGRTAAALLVLALVLFGGNEIRKAEEKRVQAEKEAKDLQQQKQATADLQAFHRAGDEVQRLFAFQDPGMEHLLSPGAEQTERTATEALALLRPWGDQLEDFPLSAEQRSGLLQQMYTVSLLLAETKSQRGTRKEAAGDVLALLDQAAQLRTPTTALRRLQAESHDLLGDREAAAEARQQADAKDTPTLALDLFLSAERQRVGHARATAGREKQTWTKEQQQQLDDAVETYRQAIALDYNHFWSHFQLSQCYLNLRKEDLALNALDACVALRPDSAWAYTLRGHVRALLRRSGDARADLEKARKLDPDLLEPPLELGFVNWLEKNYKQALDEFDAVLKAPPERRLIEAAFYRGQLHLDRGEEAEALADFTMVIKERPQGHPASLRRARIYFAQGEVQKGIADLDAFLSGGKGLDPNSPQICAERGRRMRLMLPELPRGVKKSHLLLSLEQLDKAIKQGARSAAVYDERGTVLEYLGRGPEAIEAYGEAVKLEPKEARLLVKRAWAHEKLNQYDEAAADFTAALALDASYAEAQAGLAYIQACKGQAPVDANRLAAAAVLQGAGDYLVLHNVACVYGKLSDKDPKRAREYQDLALVYLQREVELWQRDRSGPDPVPLIKNDPAFPRALKERDEFQKLIR